MTFIHDRWPDDSQMPGPPKVLTWDSSYDNPAETPYIILEYAPGVPLMTRWTKIEGRSAGAALLGLATLESTLLHQPFAYHGSLYFADDVPEDIRGLPLFPDPSHPFPAEALARSDLPLKYKVGPTVNREWWRGAYGSVNVPRGPCT